MAYRRTPRVQARLSQSRERILSAALALVAEQGYAGCSVAAVADRAGIATGSVYRHFPAKALLFADVFRTVSQREADALASAAERAPGGARARIAAMIETFAGRALRAPRQAYALLAEPVDPAVDAERLIFRRLHHTLFARVIADGVAAGELPPQDVEVSAAALVGAVGEALVGPLAAGSAGPDTIPALIAFAQRAVGAGHDT
ncbi:TetR/AcrR family transcriptional regulator [Actinomadura alba]|uniref:TetR/AcrR family transcriptional regulator n=1 Tax=Actinomadura alba TaxID=406431 RepID=A0ABR7M0M7_9ACTN|nr:TetR/AcrR family transcriptional regulator [Actinomadura alba]MBC6470290.1 TetR/AcrR family transcriptional regulator [Actinomadura alba]